jgi:hypothetical protein
VLFPENAGWGRAEAISQGFRTSDNARFGR